MPVHDAETLLREAITDRLNVLIGDDDLTVTFHLCTVPQTIYCEGEEGNEEDEGHYYERLFWRLSLFIRVGLDRYLVFSGTVPYEACFDGDPEPMQVLIDQMWEGYKFGSLMVDQDMDSHLEAVATEVEGPGAG